MIFLLYLNVSFVHSSLPVEDIHVLLGQLWLVLPHLRLWCTWFKEWWGWVTYFVELTFPIAWKLHITNDLLGFPTEISGVNKEKCPISSPRKWLTVRRKKTKFVSGSILLLGQFLVCSRPTSESAQCNLQAGMGALGGIGCLLSHESNTWDQCHKLNQSPIKWFHYLLETQWC